ncbi:MAG: hypothetical protein ACHQJ6_04760 [Candidatus Berkiellales bacterium]
MLFGKIHPDIERKNTSLPLHIRRFASGQYVCEISYLLPMLDEPLSEINILDEDGKYYPYVINPLTLKSGLVAYVLLPKDKSLKNVKVVFRGTDPTDLSSIHINAELYGPGVSSFEEVKASLFSEIVNYINDYYPTDTPLTLDVMGHSQGAAMSQLCVTEFLKRRLNSKLFDNITALNMTVLNSPGVPTYIREQADHSVYQQFIHDKPIKIVANWGMVGGDMVQVTGLDMIFVRLPYPIVENNLVKRDIGLEGHWRKDLDLSDGLQCFEIIQMFKNAIISLLGSHSNVNFFAPTSHHGEIVVSADESDRPLYSNKNPKDIPIMLRELLNKARCLSHAFYFVEDWCHRLDLQYLVNFLPSRIRSGEWLTSSQENEFDLNEEGLITQKKKPLA